MTGHPTCPRCGSQAREPGIWSNAWRCDTHGDIDPVAAVGLPTHERIVQDLRIGAARDVDVPYWLPWPLPTGWLATGITHAGNERHGVRASLVGCSGPNPLGGPADLVLVAEELGVGLGAHWAGLPGLDPGQEVLRRGGPDAKIHAAGHPTALWCVHGPQDRAVYVGEALGRWLWLVLWPASAGALVADDVNLIDLRQAPCEVSPPLGPLMARLRRTSA